MPLTRRTGKFAAIADEAERLLAERGCQATPTQVDAVLNNKIEVVATLMGVTPRAALSYAPADTARAVANETERALSAQGA
jgi:hypothetical protein